MPTEPFRSFSICFLFLLIVGCAENQATTSSSWQSSWPTLSESRYEYVSSGAAATRVCRDLGIVGVEDANYFGNMLNTIVRTHTHDRERIVRRAGEIEAAYANAKADPSRIRHTQIAWARPCQLLLSEVASNRASRALTEQVWAAGAPERAQAAAHAEMQSQLQAQRQALQMQSLANSLQQLGTAMTPPPQAIYTPPPIIPVTPFGGSVRCITTGIYTNCRY